MKPLFKNAVAARQGAYRAPAKCPCGKVGIAICFDRHLPESIRTCTRKGAQLIIIPTANTLAEPLEMFEWELRVQAFQNNVFAAMCNRVGREDKMYSCGQSLIVSPDGDILFKANAQSSLSQQSLTCRLRRFHDVSDRI